jgi:hypothetical protein
MNPDRSFLMCVIARDSFHETREGNRVGVDMCQEGSWVRGEMNWRIDFERLKTVPADGASAPSAEPLHSRTTECKGWFAYLHMYSQEEP